jgi:hypothetical protein
MPGGEPGTQSPEEPVMSQNAAVTLPTPRVRPVVTATDPAITALREAWKTAEPALTEPELREWLALRTSPDQLDHWTARLLGKTLAECDDDYEAIHGSMA